MAVVVCNKNVVVVVVVYGGVSGTDNGSALKKKGSCLVWVKSGVGYFPFLDEVESLECISWR